MRSHALMTYVLADQDVEVWMLLSGQAYQAVFPQQVMALVPYIEGQQIDVMQTFLFMPHGKQACQ